MPLQSMWTTAHKKVSLLQYVRVRTLVQLPSSQLDISRLLIDGFLKGCSCLNRKNGIKEFLQTVLVLKIELLD